MFDSKKRIGFHILIASILALCGNSFAQSFDNVEIQTMQAGENVFMLMGAGGNMGVLVGDDGALLVDDEFAPLHEKIVTAIGEISENPVKYVVNTHWHRDHTGGNELFGKENSTIIAHENVKKTLSEGQYIAFFDSRTDPYPPVALPSQTFADSTTLHINDEDISIIHIKPAHTDGDAVVYFHKANVMCTGDLLFSGGYPFIDIDHGGSIDGMIEGVETLMKMIDDQTRLIPGHGPLSDKKGLNSFRMMLKKVRNRIDAQIKSGLSREQVIASKPTADYDEKWSGSVNPDGFVGIIFDDLTR